MNSTYQPCEARYGNGGLYRRCGQSGIKLPLISLGLWHNFGGVDTFENARSIVRKAFDLGITHLDLANNYGPPPGSAEETFGRILKTDLAGYRDELIISTKAGYHMWPGPYGEWGSRKYLLASLDASLRRMGLDYVDIFYIHRFDPQTPLEETLGALDHAVRSGKALYVGISNFGAAETAAAARILRQMGTPCLLNQARYSLFDRRPETGLLDAVLDAGMGCITFSPLAQGLLTDRYLKGIPEDSRVAHGSPFLRAEHINEANIGKSRALNGIALQRGQTLAQMALAWVLRQPAVTSALIGASRPAQVEDCVGAVQALAFDAAELSAIEQILGPTREFVA